MRQNFFGDTYLDRYDSIDDYMAENDLEPFDLSAVLEPVQEEGCWMAEVHDDGGTVFFVEGHPSKKTLVEALTDVGIHDMEVAC